MPHSYVNNLLHVVFSTRERKRTIPPGSFAELWAVMAGIGRNHRLTVIKIGGMEEHVHALFALPADVTLAHAVQVLKANSSRWMRERIPKFAWQEGYAAFSVSDSVAGAVKKYIENQPEHHKRRSFEEEFVALLKKSGVPCGPKPTHHFRGGLTYSGPTGLVDIGRKESTGEGAAPVLFHIPPPISTRPAGTRYR
jgi:putative transposase